MTQDLIVVRQLPVIEEQLLQVRESIVTRVDEALALVCTEDTYKTVKKVRTVLNKEFQELEDRRKEVKRSILAPYEKFEALYKDCAGDIYTKADQQLRARIAEVEDGLKSQKQEQVAAYFDEYAQSKGIDFIAFKTSGIAVTMTVSAKNLREQAKAIIDRIADDLAMIDTQEFKEEILVEYKKTLNASVSMTTITNRHAAIDAERKRQAEILAERTRRAAGVQNTQQAIMEQTVLTSPPVAAPAPVEQNAPAAAKIYTASFTVRGSLENLRALKAFLTDGGYDYESN